MTVHHPGLRERAAQVAPLLDAIAANARKRGLDAVATRDALTRRMHPPMSSSTLKRNWNRWLAGAATLEPLPDIDVFISLMRAARASGFMDVVKPVGARELADWLKMQDTARRQQRLASAVKETNQFVAKLFSERNIFDADAEEALPALVGTFAAGIASQIAEGFSLDLLGYSAIARRAGVEGAKAVLAVMNELAAELEREEARIGISPDLPRTGKHVHMTAEEKQYALEKQAEELAHQLEQGPVGRFFKRRRVTADAPPKSER